MFQTKWFYMALTGMCVVGFICCTSLIPNVDVLVSPRIMQQSADTMSLSFIFTLGVMTLPTVAAVNMLLEPPQPLGALRTAMLTLIFALCILLEGVCAMLLLEPFPELSALVQPALLTRLVGVLLVAYSVVGFHRALKPKSGSTQRMA